MLTAGFPCQPFSYEGKGRGVRDPRGQVYQWIMKYARKNKPAMIMLENVKGLVYAHREVLEDIVLQLEEMGYLVMWRLMETHLFSGIPHKRPRVLIMALDQLNNAADGWPASGDRRGRIFADWPRPVPLAVSLPRMLDTGPARGGPDHDYARNLSKTAMKNWKAASRIIAFRARARGVDPKSMSAVVDTGGCHPQIGWDMCPCLTRTRGKSFAFWSNERRRPLSVAELRRMQGMSINDLCLQGITDTDLGAMLGNAFPCTVVARLAFKGLHALEVAHNLGVAQFGQNLGPDGTRAGYDSGRGCLGKDGIPLGYFKPHPSGRGGPAAGGRRASGKGGIAPGGRHARVSGKGDRADDDRHPSGCGGPAGGGRCASG
ncbi:MAG: DNA cytosine methyltransferase, partial [Rickettsiales bacterium]